MSVNRHSGASDKWFSGLFKVFLTLFWNSLSIFLGHERLNFYRTWKFPLIGV